MQCNRHREGGGGGSKEWSWCIAIIVCNLQLSICEYRNFHAVAPRYRTLPQGRGHGKRKVRKHTVND